MAGPSHNRDTPSTIKLRGIPAIIERYHACLPTILAYLGIDTWIGAYLVAIRQSDNEALCY